MPDQSHKNIYVVIPAFNEKEVIGSVVKQVAEQGYSIVVVDDGSEQDVGEVLKDIRVLTLVRHRVNLGQGAALQTGIDLALEKDADYIVTFDADGQHMATDIPRLLEPLINDQADIALASRFLIKGSHNAPKKRQWLLQAGRLVNYLFTGLYLSDAHNGFRALNRKAACSIRLTENRMAHATEIIAQVKQNKLRYLEIASHVSYTSYSKKKGQSGIQGVKIFFDLVLQKLFK